MPDIGRRDDDMIGGAKFRWAAQFGPLWMMSPNDAQIVAEVEFNVRKDLQFIRFNGALVGDLAGLALYTAESLLKLA